MDGLPDDAWYSSCKDVVIPLVGVASTIFGEQMNILGVLHSLSNITVGSKVENLVSSRNYYNINFYIHFDHSILNNED